MAGFEDRSHFDGELILALTAATLSDPTIHDRRDPRRSAAMRARQPEIDAAVTATAREAARLEPYWRAMYLHAAATDVGFKAGSVSCSFLVRRIGFTLALRVKGACYRCSVLSRLPAAMINFTIIAVAEKLG